MKNTLLRLFAVVIIWFTGQIQASEVINLPDLVYPNTLKLDNKQLYVASGAKIFIYSIPEFNLLKSFGKEGEGPGEFKLYDTGILLDVQSDKIFVNSQRKISYFSKSGEFIEERRTTHGWHQMHLGKGYVSMKSIQDKGLVWRVVYICDENFNFIKEIGRKKNWFQQGKMIDPTDVRPPRYCVYKNRVYVENPAGSIDAFDSNGRHLFSTTHPLERSRVTEDDKIKYHDYYKTHRAYKNLYHNLKHLIKFPDYYPSIKYFEVADDNIYVFTYPKKNDKNQLLIFDLKGRLKETLYISIPEIDPRAVYHLVAVRNNKVYQLIENPESEEYELHITGIIED